METWVKMWFLGGFLGVGIFDRLLRISLFWTKCSAEVGYVGQKLNGSSEN